MVKKPEDEVRKIVSFDSASWVALSVLSQDTMLSIQELVDEAVRDLLIKRGRPALLLDALKASVPETERPKRRRTK